MFFIIYFEDFFIAFYFFTFELQYQFQTPIS